MVTVATGILSRIVGQKRAELAGLESMRGEWERLASDRLHDAGNTRDFRAALKQNKPAIIAEIKKASPSKGVLVEQFDPAAIARAYFEGGAAALSVLTDREFFQGAMADLQAARAAVSIPVLRKDFTIDDIHVVQAAANGADAILLIAAVLEERELRRFRELAAEFNLAALVEVHDGEELKAALASGAEIVGVNNRDLNTFEVKIETSLRLVDQIPSGVIKVSESGIHSGADARRLSAAGFDALLVGEHLMRSGDPAAALRGLRL
jgi:indole-3-glycerol phosphate synthase